MYPRVETPQVVFVEWPTEVHEEWTTLRHAVKRKARAFGYDNKTLRHFLAKFEKYNLMDVPATPKELGLLAKLGFLECPPGFPLEFLKELYRKFGRKVQVTLFPGSEVFYVSEIRLSKKLMNSEEGEKALSTIMDTINKTYVLDEGTPEWFRLSGWIGTIEETRNRVIIYFDREVEE